MVRWLWNSSYLAALFALDSFLRWCMCGNRFCFFWFHWSVSTAWANKCFPMAGNEPFRLQNVVDYLFFSFLEGQKCNLLWLLVLFSLHELLKQDSHWGDHTGWLLKASGTTVFLTQRVRNPKGWFQHSCNLEKGKKSVSIGKQRIKDQNIEVKWKNNEAKWKTGIPGWPQCWLPQQHSCHHRISPSIFPFLVSGWSWHILALFNYLCKQCLSNPNSLWARDISGKKQVRLNQIQHLQMESHGRWEKSRSQARLSAFTWGDSSQNHLWSLL